MKGSSFILLFILTLWIFIGYLALSPPKKQALHTNVAATEITTEEEIQIENGFPDCPASLQTLREQQGIIEDPRFASPLLIVVEKKVRHMGLYRDGVLELEKDGVPKCWKVALAYDAPPGPKQREGDYQTPEGWYKVSDRPGASYKDALLVHYPNCDDASRGKAAGLINESLRRQICQEEKQGAVPPQFTQLGGQILIHTEGMEDQKDWTLGCIALSKINLQKLRNSLPASKKAMILILP